MTFQHSYDSTLYLGGDLELQVPIRVTYTFEGGYRRTRTDPGCADALVDERATRLDGLQWHDGCQRAFEAWWDKSGHSAALADFEERRP